MSQHQSGSQGKCANSSSNCDGGDREVEEYLMRGFEAKRLSRTMVESILDESDVASSKAVEESTFGEVLSDQAVGVFVAGTLSRSSGVGEVDARAECLGDGSVVGEFTAVIQGQGVRVQAVQCTGLVPFSGDRVCDIGGRLGQYRGQAGIQAFAFHREGGNATSVTRHSRRERPIKVSPSQWPRV